MTPISQDSSQFPLDDILQGDCRNVMKRFPDNYFHSIITDPPYELGFMGKKWDSSGIAYDPTVWSEAMRVLRPGGYLLSFGGDRTEHRMVCAIENAGFEIRGKIVWLQGQGFPKSLNVSGKINSLIPSDLRCVCAHHSKNITSNSQSYYRLERDLCDGQLPLDRGSGLNTFPSPNDALLRNHDDPQTDGPSLRRRHILGHCECDHLSIDDFALLLKHLLEDSLTSDNILCDILKSTLRGEQMVSRKKESHISGKSYLESDSVSFVSNLNSPIYSISEILFKCTQCNKYFALPGLGTSLKPAHELVCMARKPLSEKTIAENVLKWECGGINIDGCRVPIPSEDKARYDFNNNGLSRLKRPEGDKLGQFDGGWKIDKTPRKNDSGRFPSNFFHDGSPEIMAEFAKVGITKSGAMKKEVPSYDGESTTGFLRGRSGPSNQHGDSGSVARFFQSCPYTDLDYPPFIYCSKASKKERGADNNHPTVKPLSLLRTLCRLTTPPNGIILDPFSGSGTTCLAAKIEGFHFVGIESNPEYIEISKKRLKNQYI